MRKTCSAVKQQIGILGQRMAELRAAGGQATSPLAGVLHDLAREQERLQTLLLLRRVQARARIVDLALWCDGTLPPPATDPPPPEPAFKEALRSMLGTLAE